MEAMELNDIAEMLCRNLISEGFIIQRYDAYSSKNPSFRSSLAIYRAKKEKLMREKQEAKMRDKRRLNNDLISVYREFLNRTEPLSDAWCDCYNALQLELYHAELLEERR